MNQFLLEHTYNFANNEIRKQDPGMLRLEMLMNFTNLWAAIF